MALADLALGSDDLGSGDVASRANIRAYLAEMIGTMLFVLIGTGAVVSSVGAQASDALIIIALAHGLGIGLMVYATGNISGGHLNPAVTLGMIVTKNIKILPGVIYMAAQILGAIIATLLLYLIVRNDFGELSNFGAHGISNGVDGNGGAFLLEALLTAVLLIVIFATAVSKKGAGHMAPLAIGLTVAAIHLVAVPLTGASVNPARTLGPALVSNAFDSLWVYMLAPALGGVGGALLYWFVLRETEGTEAGDSPEGDNA
jgi:MIP family channel proteins